MALPEPPEERTATEAAAERHTLLAELQEWLEAPMLVLAFVWIAVFVVEVVAGVGPFLTALGYFIWGVFVLQFALELTIAPDKSRYLRHNWLTAIALLAPALRLLRVVRIVRIARLSRAAGTLRGARLVRLVSSLNRSMRALRATMSRRGFGYVLLLTIVVNVAGAAGMYAFEAESFDSYTEALWWTAMLITTIASDYWPQSGEGRLLCLLLSLYGLAVFGYVTATLATYFIGRDAEEQRAIGGARAVAELRREIEGLRRELAERR